MQKHKQTSYLLFIIILEQINEEETEDGNAKSRS